MGLPAPYFGEIAQGPEVGYAFWLTADDGVHLRAVHWPCAAQRGTVLLFPGRTEYCEKYGRTAAQFAERGLGTLAIDWRGQGLADRLADDPMLGHVERFGDYQRDVRAFIDAARRQGAPEPYYLVGHSMGGCIGLRALHEGLPVEAAAFSAPMWGIYLAPQMRPAAWTLANLTSRLGLGVTYAPGTKNTTLVLTDRFENNTLSTCREMWDYMVMQAEAEPQLTLAGPSLHWLAEALRETNLLHDMPSPQARAITFLGTNERIVDMQRIRLRMRSWKNGELVIVNGGEHEVLMERWATRHRIVNEMCDFFEAR